MEPRIPYAHTEDGVSIAFWTMGAGIPFVVTPFIPFSHVQLEWQWPEYRRWYERLAEKRKLVRYDNRGSGLSDRDVTDYSLDAHVLDLEAVVDRLGQERLALFGIFHAGSVAIAYAARHPERVSHLILWCSYARASDYSQSPQVQAMRALLGKDWEVYRETVAHIGWGWAAGEQARRFAAFMGECVTQEAFRAAVAGILGFDVVDLLPKVGATLVLHRRQAPFPDVGLAKDLASRIADSRLAVLEGTTIAPFQGDMEAVLAAIDEFLGEGEEAAAPAAPSGLVTILFTDMEGSTVLIQRLGDAKAQDVLHTHNGIVREALKAHGGSEVDMTGDGFMASFSSATKALECAIAMQRAFAEHNVSAEEPIKVRVGMNAGEPIAEDDDLFGTAVNLAARICSHAEAGQILAADVVQQLAAGKGFDFADKGEAELKGFEKPVRLHEVRWQE